MGNASLVVPIPCLNEEKTIAKVVMVIGSRIAESKSEFRRMNRKLVKSLPLIVRGFEIEAEITIKALERGFRLVEVPVDLRPRMEGSYSKIHILRDGLRILGTIFSLFRDYKPLTFFGSLGLTSTERRSADCVDRKRQHQPLQTTRLPALRHHLPRLWRRPTDHPRAGLRLPGGRVATLPAP